MIPDAKYTMPSPPMGTGLVGAGTKQKPKAKSDKVNTDKSKKPTKPVKPTKTAKTGGDASSGIAGLAVPFAIYLLNQAVPGASSDQKQSKSRKPRRGAFDGPGSGAGRKAAVGGSDSQGSLGSQGSQGSQTQLYKNIDKFLTTN